MLASHPTAHESTSPKWDRVKVTASGTVVFTFPKSSPAEAPATVFSVKEPAKRSACKRAETLPDVDTQDVCFFFPLENAPEEMSIVQILDPAFPWPQAFSEFCNAIDGV